MWTKDNINTTKDNNKFSSNTMYDIRLSNAGVKKTDKITAAMKLIKKK